MKNRWKWWLPCLALLCILVSGVAAPGEAPVLHDSIEESYPGQAGAYLWIRLSGGKKHE